MRILADECVFRVTVEALRQSGHDVLTAQEMGLAGQSDMQVVTAAKDAGRLFLTNDMHFSNILLFPPALFHGMIVLRIRPRNQTGVHSILTHLLVERNESDLDGALVIVDPNKYRLRRGRE